MTKKVIVTGASGYIGGQTMIALVEAGHTVIGIDWLPLPPHLIKFAKDHDIKFHQFDYGSEVGLNLMTRANTPDAIIHCAAHSLVEPSMRTPEIYYENNVVSFKKLIDQILGFAPNCRLIFSSSASTYGNPVMIPIAEEDPQQPISPYGESKLMGEMMLRSYHRARGLDFVSFRYFNATGADHQQRHGQAPGATHIIAQMLERHRRGEVFVINGRDFDTADGTCVRDYTHVEDIVAAHLMALNTDAVPSDFYNLGTGEGFSNLQVYNTACQIVGDIKMEFGDARPGDPAVLTASSAKLQKLTGWQPTYSLEDIITHAWNWYERV